MTLKETYKALLQKAGLAIAFCCFVFIITNLALRFSSVVNPTTVAFSFLILVILSAVFSGLAVAIVVSSVATLCFNYFFLEPVGTWNIAQLNDWIALFVFLFSSILISRLTASSAEKAHQLELMKKTVAGLRELGEWLLCVPRERVTLTAIAKGCLEIFDLQYCSIHVYAEGRWHHYSGNAYGAFDREIAETLKRVEDHSTDLMEIIDEHALGLRYAQISQEKTPVALLTVKSKDLPFAAIQMIASMIGILLTELLSDRPLHLSASN